MRRESSRLREGARALADLLTDVGEGPEMAAVLVVITATLRALEATADDLNEGGAALQSYATDLAEGHELGRRAELRVRGASLLLDGTRVIEPWGPASADEAERRRPQMPDVQARVDLATALVGRAHGGLTREMTRLTKRLSGRSPAARQARSTPLPSRRSSPAR
jgi:hypothetical protein